MRRLALTSVILLAVAAGPARPSESRPSPDAVLTALFSNIPPDDFDYDAGARLGELEEALGKAQAGAGPASPSSCLRSCDDTHRVLEKSCDVLLQPAAARSRAVCEARVVDIRQQCRMRCGR